MKKTLKIALVDDHEKVREQVKAEFKKSEGRFKLISFFDTVEAANRELPSIRPDVVLVDILFPNGRSGVECVSHVAPLLPAS